MSSSESKEPCGVLLRVPARDGVFDDLFRFVEASEFFDFGAAGFLEVLVVVKVELDLLQKLLWEILESLVAITTVAIVGRNGDDFIVDFTAVDELHDAEDASLCVDSGRQGLVSNH